MQDAPDPTLRIARLDLRDRAVATQVLALLREAHEAEVLAAGVPGEQAFGHTLDGLMDDRSASADAGRDRYHGAWLGTGEAATLIACVSVADAAVGAGEPAVAGFGNLAVRVTHRRQGIARTLMAAVMAELHATDPGRAMTVVTGLDNGPALALYAGLGFVPVRCGTLGPLSLPVVQLLRTADAGPPVPTTPPT